MKRTPNYGLPIVENNDRYSKEEQNNAMNIIDTELGSMSEAFRDTLNDINNTFEEVKEFEGKIQADYDTLKTVYDINNGFFTPHRLHLAPFNTSNRPSEKMEGMVIYDFNLKKPIVWNGTNWTDFIGNIV